MKGARSGFEGYGRRELRQALKRADSVIFERVLQFLEDDPKTFGSGYSKEMMWRYIRRYDLTDDNKRRLENAALKYLQRRMMPEFKRMCQSMAYIGSPQFWDKVKQNLNSDDPIAQINAYCLYQYANGLRIGEQKRLKLKRIKHELLVERLKRQRGSYCCDRYGKTRFYGRHVMEVLEMSRVWKDGNVISRTPNFVDLPITRRGSYDETIASFDYTGCYDNRLIASLAHILWDGSYHDVGTTCHAWVYVMYVYGELHSDLAFPIIRGFYEQRIEDQFETAGKWWVVNAMCRALERIDTLHAREFATSIAYPDTPLSRHMKTFNFGWIQNKK